MALLVAGAAWAAGTLTAGGAAAAWLVGVLVLSATGWSGALVLGAFFVPSTLVGRLTRGRPSAGDAKGERRDPAQVLANGGAAALGALLEATAPGLGLWIVTCSLAAAAADTWATSIGTLSRSDPRLLGSGRAVPVGTSGAVSRLGTLGAVGGGLLVGVAGGLAGGGLPLLAVGTGIGFVGMLLDSLIGAVWQGRHLCPVCAVASERRIHRCGARTKWVGGLKWLDNDAVNALTTGFAAIAGGLAWCWFSSTLIR